MSESVSREIQEYCLQEHEHRQYEKETHHVMLESMKEQKEDKDNKVEENVMKCISR